MLSPTGQIDDYGNHRFIFENCTFENLTEKNILRHANGIIDINSVIIQQVYAVHIELNHGVFIGPAGMPPVTIMQHESNLLTVCTCNSEPGKLCEHQVYVLLAIVRKEELGIFFNPALRHEKLKKAAADYGLEYEPDLDSFFQPEYLNGKLFIKPLLPGIFPVTRESLDALSKEFTSDAEIDSKKTHPVADTSVCVVLRRHKYYKYLVIELYNAALTKEGGIKNPLNLVSPLDFIWQSEDPDHLKFFSGIAKFQNHSDTKRSGSDITALKAIIKNPGSYNFYYHDAAISENITANSIVPVKTGLLPGEVNIEVIPQDHFYELTASIIINGKVCSIKDVSIKFTYFITVAGALYLVDRLQVMNLIELLKKRSGSLLIHVSKFAMFRSQVLHGLQDKVHIEYEHIKTATPAQVRRLGFNNEPAKLIYLSDFGSHVMIIPVMKYDDVEIPVRTKRQIYTVDDKGKEFTIKRNNEAEILFTALLVKQHPYFEEQLENDLYYFYLHKKQFLNEEWFLNCFDEWQKQDITILGFNEIKENKLNRHKVKIDIKVISGINWFNAVVGIKYGKKKASLKQLYKAIHNKSRYIQLDDGTLGILPAEWVEKFSAYFNAGEIADEETIHIPKINFSAIEQFFSEDVLEEPVKKEIALYKEKLSGFDHIKEAEVPAELQAILRPYQRQGLSWLNFLDDFNFGGCLADDMGLGKSVQVIAFILSQRKKSAHNTNLLVVPATLIFNWQVEIQKFAPSIKIHTVYGAERIKNTGSFNSCEVILTSYGTLLSDIRFLKEYIFNYIFLDESQHIKNPESERYKAVRLLKSRNRIVITGTPLENNTFDIFGQFSFACPGLLGNKKYFKDVYAIPIDKFKNSKRATELQYKINPFILRRTKQQVAPELPDKTEMILYCEMKSAQRKIYDAYEKEFREYIAATTGEELHRSPMNVLKGLTKLRQVCNSPVLLGSDDLSGKESSKMDMLMEQVEAKSLQHKMLIFSQFVSMLDLIKKELEARNIKFALLTGNTRNREAVVNEFQNDPDVKIFLISLKAGGTGLNLTEADYVYLVDPWWNPSVENQAIDRTHRIGQNKKIMAVRLICPGTVEEKIMKMQESKKELVSDLINTDSSFLKSLSKEELLSWFS